MYDVHVHLLPGLDDGCATLEESLTLARYLVSAGVHCAIATVHSLPGAWDLPPDRVEAAVRQMRESLAAAAIPLEVHVANEIMVHQGLVERVTGGELLCFGKGRYALVELPVHEIPWFAFTTIEHLVEVGFTPVVAHPERCYPLHRDPDEMRSWYAKGILAQLDAGSITGAHGARVRRFAEYLVRHHLVHLLGSDLHAPPRSGDPWRQASERVVKLGGADYARVVTEELPRAILEGADISRTVPPPRSPKTFSIGRLASRILGYAPRE